MECLGGVILAGIVGAVFAIYSYSKTKATLGAMKEHTYQDIATKWHLWDEFVNFHFYIETPRGALRGGDPIDFDPKANPKMKSRPMDYDTFYQCPTEEKIKMLVADFGEEQNK